MIRGFFRLVGLLLLAGGFIFMVYDGARFVADQTLQFTRFGQFWNDVHQSSQQAFRAWVDAHPESKRPIYHVAHSKGVIGLAANFVMHIAEQMKKEGVAFVVREREEALAVQ